MEASRKYKAEVRNLAHKNIPIETTDIGRIQKLLRKIMLNSRGVAETVIQIPREPGEKSVDGETGLTPGRRRSSLFAV